MDGFRIADLYLDNGYWKVARDRCLGAVYQNPASRLRKLEEQVSRACKTSRMHQREGFPTTMFRNSNPAPPYKTKGSSFARASLLNSEKKRAQCKPQVESIYVADIVNERTKHVARLIQRFRKQALSQSAGLARLRETILDGHQYLASNLKSINT
uniref:Uncharacterized protein n=1 Tax=Spongospora subterranea TaxID=70186 RepID=A0A0H5R0A8_9EUKA|eukprot:CRZ01224.1 hypothetical protein [Spongospora subterranea]